jgi:hypothetical protein
MVNIQFQALKIFGENIEYYAKSYITVQNNIPSRGAHSLRAFNQDILNKSS